MSINCIETRVLYYESLDLIGFVFDEITKNLEKELEEAEKESTKNSELKFFVVASGYEKIDRVIFDIVKKYSKVTLLAEVDSKLEKVTKYRNYFVTRKLS